MADRSQPLGPAAVAGWLAAVTVLGVVLGSIAVVAISADTTTGLRRADWAAVRFTLLQATLSAAISVLLAVPVARALARRRFAGRRVLIAVFSAPFILPVIVAILGLIAVFGREGWLGAALGLAGITPPPVYGLHGVVLAHVFFNLPLAIRFLLQGWAAIPAERFRLAASLGMGPREVFRAIEVPMLRATLPGAALVVFLICLSSFAVALTLGGGPRATTIELAIFQAFRFDFDLSRAALLALVQVGLTVLATALAFRVAVPVAFGSGLDRITRRWDAGTGLARAVDGVAIALAALFLALPLMAVLISGLPRLTTLPPEVWHAAARSVAVALVSAGLTLVLAATLSAAVVAYERKGRRRPAALVEAVGYVTIAASPLVIGTGLFLAIFPLANPAALALPVTALVNALMSLPFVLRMLLPALRDVTAQTERLADSLDMPRGARLRLVLLPRLRAPVGFCLGLSAALSMGDLGVIALFADPHSPTLPLQVYRLMGAFRMEDAAAAALVLVALSFAMFWVFDRGGGRTHA